MCVILHNKFDRSIYDYKSTLIIVFRKSPQRIIQIKIAANKFGHLDTGQVIKEYSTIAQPP